MTIAKKQQERQLLTYKWKAKTGTIGDPVVSAILIKPFRFFRNSVISSGFSLFSTNTSCTPPGQNAKLSPEVSRPRNVFLSTDFPPTQVYTCFRKGILNTALVIRQLNPSSPSFPGRRRNVELKANTAYGSMSDVDRNNISTWLGKRKQIYVSIIYHMNRYAYHVD